MILPPLPIPRSLKAICYGDRVVFKYRPKQKWVVAAWVPWSRLMKPISTPKNHPQRDHCLVFLKDLSHA